MMLHMAMASAQSVPGRRRRWYLARVAIQLTRGSMDMISAPRFMRSMMAWPKNPSPFDSSGALPHSMMYFGTSKRGSS